MNTRLLASERHAAGLVAGGNTAKPAQLVAAVQAVLEELLNAPPSEEEIAQAKQSAANSFVFQFSSKQQQLGRILVYSVLGLPEVRAARWRDGPLDTPT